MLETWLRKIPFELKTCVAHDSVNAINDNKSQNVSLLIALTLYQNSGPRTNWERGFEMLPGALQAVSDINNDSVLLPGHTLKLIAVDGGRNEFKIVQQFINLTFYRQVNIVGIGGILDPKVVSILLPLVEHKRVLISTITHTDKLGLGRLGYSGAYLPLPSPSAMASVLLHFIREMNWKYSVLQPIWYIYMAQICVYIRYNYACNDCCDNMGSSVCYVYNNKYSKIVDLSVSIGIYRLVCSYIVRTRLFPV